MKIMNRKQFKEYIKEIIKETLSEGPQEDTKVKQKKIEYLTSLEAAAKAEKAALNKPNTKPTLEENALNEMANPLKKGIKPSEKIEPRYKKENYKKVVDLILSKVDGEKTMADIARELGVVQQKIRPVVADLISVGILEKGESKSGKNTDNKPNPKEETPKKETPKKETPKKETPKKEKKAKDEDEEEVEDNWNKSSDDDGMEDEKSIDKKAQAAAKKGGGDNTPEEKKIKFNQFLASIQKNKSDKAKVSGLLKIAKDKYELPKTMMDDLLRAAGREVE
jgi:hypothetical protein